MKKSLCLAASLLALNLAPVFSQPNSPMPAPPSGPTFQQRLQEIVGSASSPAQAPVLTKFNLDFPGGTPEQLVKAIEKAMGKPLNAIIPDEDADTKLPPLKLSEITFPQLSDTLRIGSAKSKLVWMINANGSQYNQMVSAGYYFNTIDDRPTDNSVWFFHVAKIPEQPTPPPVQKVCRFYSLATELDHGFTVDDITTAIQTGWKMTGVSPTPELNYHKETGLLIAFGEPDKLKTINDVLETLPQIKSAFWQDMNKNIYAAQQQIKQLQTQVDQLNKQLNPPPPSNSSLPAEKSGK